MSKPQKMKVTRQQARNGQVSGRGKIEVTPREERIHNRQVSGGGEDEGDTPRGKDT